MVKFNYAVMIIVLSLLSMLTFMSCDVRATYLKCYAGHRITFVCESSVQLAAGMWYCDGKPVGNLRCYIKENQ